jgi:hypothetical protein
MKVGSRRAITPPQRIDLLVPCGITHRFPTGPGDEQFFDDLKVVGPRLVDG